MFTFRSGGAGNEAKCFLHYTLLTNRQEYGGICSYLRTSDHTQNVQKKLFFSPIKIKISIGLYTQYLEVANHLADPETGGEELVEPTDQGESGGLDNHLSTKRVHPTLKHLWLDLW